MLNKHSCPLSVYLLMGSVFGGLFGLLTFRNISASLPYWWLSVLGLMLALTYPLRRSNLLLLGTSLIISFLASIPFVWPSNEFSMSYWSLVIVSAYALHCFHLVYHEQGAFRFPYKSLFHAVWDSMAMLLIAGFMTLLCWIILWLCSTLFVLIDLRGLDRLLGKSWFISFSSSLFMVMGIYLGEQAKTIVIQIRQLLLNISKLLLPILISIGLLFLLSLLSTQHMPQSDPDLTTSVLNTFTLLVILLLNGVYQDGQSAAPYAKPWLYILRFFITILPAFPLLAVYLVFNVPKPSLLQINYAALTNTSLLLFLSIAYAFIVNYKPNHWLGNISNANKRLALLLIIVCLASNHYWMPPPLRAIH